MQLQACSSLSGRKTMKMNEQLSVRLEEFRSSDRSIISPQHTVTTTKTPTW